MKNSNKSLAPRLTFVSLACFFIPLSIFLLWLIISSQAAEHAERVAIFHTYFPDFLRGRYSTTYLSLIGCVLAIILSSISMKYADKTWKIVNSIILILSFLLMLLNLSSLM